MPLRDLRVGLGREVVAEDPPAAGARARKEQALAVAAPRRLDVDARMRRDGLLRPAIGADDADLQVAGRLVTRRRCVAPSGTPRRLEVIRRTGRDRDRFAAVGRDLPDVAAHRERDPAAVGTPRRIERPGRHRRHHVPLFAIAVAVAIRGGHSTSITAPTATAAVVLQKRRLTIHAALAASGFCRTGKTFASVPRCCAATAAARRWKALISLPPLIVCSGGRTHLAFD